MPIFFAYGEVEAEEESGEYQPYREILQAVVRGFGTRLGFVVSEQEQQSLPNSLPNWKPFPDTVAALRPLKKQFKLGILSNIDDDLFSSTAPQLGIEFDTVVTASQARAYKPSLDIFRLAQKKIGLPSRAVASCGAEYLPRRHSGAVDGDCYSLGKSPVAAAQLRRGETSPGKARPRGVKPQSAG